MNDDTGGDVYFHPKVERNIQDAQGFPIELGRLYLWHQPYQFTIVMVTSFDRHTRGNFIGKKIWPVTPHLHDDSLNLSPRALTRLDPAIVGREVRGLLEWFNEYRESLTDETQ